MNARGNGLAALRCLTMLFSRMLALPKERRMEMERTEMGMEAATVRPARRADVDGGRYTKRTRRGSRG